MKNRPAPGGWFACRPGGRFRGDYWRLARKLKPPSAGIPAGIPRQGKWTRAMINEQ